MLLPAPALVPDPGPVLGPAPMWTRGSNPKPPMFRLVGAAERRGHFLLATMPVSGVGLFVWPLHPAPVVLIAPRLAK